MHTNVRFCSKGWLLVLSLAAIFSSIPSQATEPAAPIKQTISAITMTPDHALALTIEDTAAVANACDLSVDRFEYLPAIGLLTLHTLNAPCPLDMSGKRKTDFIWTLPMSLRAGGDLHILLNDDSIFDLKLTGKKASISRHTEN